MRSGRTSQAESPQPLGRRLFFLGCLGLGSAMIGFLAATLRYFVPNVLYEPSRRFDIGPPSGFPPGSVTFLSDRQLYVFNEAEGFYAISAVCTRESGLIEAPRFFVAGGRRFEKLCRPRLTRVMVVRLPGFDSRKELAMTTMTRERECSAVTTCLLRAFELGERSWKLGFSTGVGQRPRVRRIAAGAIEAIGHEILKAKARLGLPPDAPVISRYEAGREAF
jgi:hypothetical protein